MRRAMAEAEVGDDVFGEDPTVNELERLTAELLGKEAAMFVPSGTMANQLAVRLHTRIGDELLTDAGAHVYAKEAGAAAALSGVSCRGVPAKRGIFTAEDLVAAVRPADVHHAPARLVWVENTHNVGGGSVWPIDTLARVSRAARDCGLSLHLDGARLWNAAAASGVAECEFAAHADSVSVCYSKGLGAPVGSALAGSKDLIATGRRFRKQLGGGMRQAGILAAAALYALRHHRPRISEDHANAKALAEGLVELGADIDGGTVDTNIVRFRTPGVDASAVAAALRKEGIAIMATGPDAFRAVTHLMISAADVATTLRAIADALSSQRPAGALRRMAATGV
jgi:threonine aldolase